MRRKIFSFLILLSLAFTTSGCVKYTTTLEIDNKNQVTLSQITAFNEAPIQEYNPDYKLVDDIYYKEYQKEFYAKKYKVNEFFNGDFEGIQTSKQFDIKGFKAQDLPRGFRIAQDEENGTSDKPIYFKKTPFKSIYKLHLIFDSGYISPYPIDEDGREIKIEEKYKDYVFVNPPQGALSIKSTAADILSKPNYEPQANLTIKIPKQAKKHNATIVISDREYRWDLTKPDAVDIYIEYERYNAISIIFTILIIVATIFAVVRNRQYALLKNKNENRSAF